MKKVIVTAALMVAALNVALAQQPQTPFVSVSGSAQTEVQPNKINVQVVLNEADSKGKISINELENKFSAALKASTIDTKKQLVLVSQSAKAVKKTDSYQYKTFDVWVTNAQELTILFNELQINEIQNARVTKIENTNIKAINDSLAQIAVLNAKEAANLIVAPLGQSIGEAIEISCDLSTGGTVYGGNYIAEARAKTMNADSSPSPLMEETKIRPITARQYVSVKFRLKP